MDPAFHGQLKVSKSKAGAPISSSKLTRLSFMKHGTRGTRKSNWPTKIQEYIHFQKPISLKVSSTLIKPSLEDSHGDLLLRGPVTSPVFTYIYIATLTKRRNLYSSDRVKY
jgi:hypothetical protein